MDGLDVIGPYGDIDFAGLRTSLTQDPGLDLDGFFAMHPGLVSLMPLWQQEELAFVQAVSTPYRDRRSHFDGQDLLEAGTMGLGERRDGWLNRLLQLQSGLSARTSFAVGQGELLLMQGQAPVSDWSPDADLSLTPQAERLARVMMQNDPLFAAALTEALELSRSGAQDLLSDESGEGPEQKRDIGMMEMPRVSRGKAHLKLAEFTAKQLRGETRVASFSLNGWDTHSRQTHSPGCSAPTVE